jgi:hypothetical protein
MKKSLWFIGSRSQLHLTCVACCCYVIILPESDTQQMINLDNITKHKHDTSSQLLDRFCPVLKAEKVHNTLGQCLSTCLTNLDVCVGGGGGLRSNSYGAWEMCSILSKYLLGKVLSFFLCDVLKQRFSL